MKFVKALTIFSIAITVLYIEPCLAASEQKVPCPLPPSYSGWSKQGYNQAEFDKDNQICFKSAEGQFQPKELMKRNSIIDQCLTEKGYVKQSAPIPLHTFASDDANFRIAYCLGVRGATLDHYNSLDAPQFREEITKNSDKIAIYRNYFHERGVILDAPSEVASYIDQGRQEFQSTIVNKNAQMTLSTHCIFSCIRGSSDVPYIAETFKVHRQCMADNDCYHYPDIASKRIAGCDEVDWLMPPPSYCNEMPQDVGNSAPLPEKK